MGDGVVPKRYAVLAWGSLLWSPRNLEMDGEWSPSGPTLPIEFCRIATDGRLTLIVDREHGVACRTWACDSPLGLEEAVGNLAAREGCDPERIGWVDRSFEGTRNSRSAFVAAWVARWCAARDLAGALWTDLPSTFEDAIGASFTVETGIDYLASLTGEIRERAFEYVRNAPSSTATPLRRAFEARW